MTGVRDGFGEDTGFAQTKSRPILVVEDDNGLRGLILKALHKAGYEAEGAATGTAAIKRIKKDPELVLLLDHNLPDMTGRNVISSLNEAGLLVPFIVMTGQGDEQLAVDMMKQGAADYKVKDLDLIQSLPGAFQRLFRQLDTDQRLRDAEEALRESEERFRAISDLALDAIIMINDASKIVYWSPSAAKTFGHTSEEVKGKDVYEILVPEEHRNRCRSGLEKLRHTGQEHIGGKLLELTFKHKNGKEIPVEISFSPITIKGKIWASAIIRDISVRKQAEQKIADYTLELEQLYRHLDRELEKALQVHARIMPSFLPVLDGISFAAYYQPAQRMGSDFYDLIQVGEKLIFYLSDVSGHGLDGAMLSVFVKHTIKSYVSFIPAHSISPARILSHLAAQFRQENYPEELYICIFLAVLDLNKLELTYCGAGFQEEPLLHSGNGEKLKLTPRGLFITSYLPAEIHEFHEECIALTGGTTLLCTTDGLTEQDNQGTYYMERLPDVFYQNTHLPPQLISQAVVEDFRSFNNGSLQGDDDITFLIMKMDPV